DEPARASRTEAREVAGHVGQPVGDSLRRLADRSARVRVVAGDSTEALAPVVERDVQPSVDAEVRRLRRLLRLQRGGRKAQQYGDHSTGPFVEHRAPP